MPKNYSLNAEMGNVGSDFGLDNIMHIKVPELPQFRFEWHPKNGMVYVIHIGSTPEMADPISDNVRDRPTAEKVILIWVSGYQSARLSNLLSRV